MQYQVAHSHGKDQRVAPRTDVYARVALTLPDGVQTMVTIVNISADGLLMRHDRSLPDGSHVSVMLPIIGRVFARTIWSLGARTGINFETTIPVDDYAALLRAFGVRSAG